MKTFRIIIAAVFLVNFVVLNAFASVLTAAPGKPEPQRLRWKGRTIKIAISSSLTQPNSNIKTDSDVMGAIRRSLEAWQSVADIDLLLETSDKQSVSQSGPYGDGVSLITIAQSPENVLLFSKNPLAESAKTRVFYNRKGFVTEADIVLNPFQQFSTDGTFGTFDLESTLTHEIGHLLGLRHSGVLGATMSDSFSRNGMFGSEDIGLRTLSVSDVAAVRELYGAAGDDEICCGTITGKLFPASGRTSKNIRVWAEESETGRVAAQTEAGNDGSFRLGGMPGGTYSLFWQKRENAVSSSVGTLGSIKVEKGETETINERIVVRRSEIVLNYTGLNSQLADSAITVSAGREYVIYLGGRNLDPRSINIGFSSPFFKISQFSIAEQDFGEDISVLSFVVKVDADALPGVYSIFATGEDGAITALIGAINVK